MDVCLLRQTGRQEYRKPFDAQRAFVLMWQGFLQGWLTKQSKEVLGGELTPAVQAASSSRETTKSSKREVSKIRDRSKNTAQLTLFVLLDTKIKRDVGILHYCVRPVRHAQNILAKRLKSLDEVCAYYQEMAQRNSSFLGSVDVLLRPFSRFDDLGQIGFVTAIDSGLCQQLHKDLMSSWGGECELH